jgi:hypothetical protein
MKHETTHPPAEMPAKGFSPGFAALGLEAALLTTLDTLGYEEPTPIQREAIPPLLAGRDLLGQAATGTGKTAALRSPCSSASPTRRDAAPPRLFWCRPESWPYRSAKPSRAMAKN